MSGPVLRQLGLGRVQRIYKLDVQEITAALQEAAKRHITDKVVWDALLYRAALLRAELRPVDIALTVDALGKARRREPDFVSYLMEEIRLKSRRFLPRDTALVLNGFAKLAVRDELLTASLVPPLLRRISEKTRWEDLALLSLAFARLGDRAREPVFDRVVAAATPRINRVTDGHALSLLVCAFTRPPMIDSSDAGAQPLFAEPEPSAAAPEDPAAEPEELPHLAFVEILLAQCSYHLWSFRGGDLLHLCLALSTLARRGREDLFPPRLLKRIEKRLQSLHFELLPVQFIRLLEVIEHLPELERACAAGLLDELAYRMREVTPRSAIAVLRTVRRVGGHGRAHSAAAWRLARDDAASELSAAEVCEAAELLAALRPCLWESREAMLCLLQGLQRRRLEPEPAMLARLLRVYADVGVRDTHWFHLCAKISVCDLAGVTPFAPRSRAPPSELEEQVVADTLFALARLNLPQLVDASQMITRAVRCIRSPEPAAMALEAAGLMSLVGWRPKELHRASTLEPLALAAAGADALPAPLRLFPFCDMASACEEETLLAWRRQAAERHGRAGAPEPLSLAIAQELASWSGVRLQRGVAVGPVHVPCAVDLVSLAEHLAESPLRAPEQVFPLGADADTLSDDEEFGAAAGGGGEGSEDGEGSEEGEESEAEAPARGRALRRPRGRRRRRAEAPIEIDEQGYGEARPETHVLVLPLRDLDFFHASATLRGERQRAKLQVLGATRFAEVTLLKRLGWRVICVAEHLWSWGSDNDPEAAASNKELIYGLVASLKDAPT